MAQKTDAELTSEANVIGNETTEGANTADRVRDMLVNIIDSKGNNFTTYRKTAAQWTSDNTVLGDGVKGEETDTGKFKVGDGATAWNSLAYAGGGGAWGSITGTLSDQTDLQSALNAKAASSHTHAISDVTSLQTSLDAKNDKAVAFRTEAGTTFTIQSSDYGLRIQATSNSNVTAILPPGLSTGFWCEVQKKGTGNVSHAADTGASLESYGTTITQQYGIALLVHEGGGVWSIHGRII